MLFAAFRELLEEKGFEAISVHDIAERSTVNRATFYDHFTDKFALLEAMIGEKFRLFLAARLAGTDGSCEEGLRQLILAVCDFLSELASAPCQKQRKQFNPMVEAKVKTMVRDFLVAGMKNHGVPEEEAILRGTVAGWAICGAALEWTRTKRPSAELFAEKLMPLVQPSCAARV
jgi:AcrR family transcriptional regulator